MFYLFLTFALGGVLDTGLAAATSQNRNESSYNLRPFHINLSSSVPHMMDLVERTQLPPKPLYDALGESAGIDFDTLRDLRMQWLEDFNWSDEQASMNGYKHYTAEIEGMTIHFVHEKSTSPTAIPLILNHGWPSSFLEFLPLVDSLVQPSRIPSPNATYSTAVASNSSSTVSFHVVIPSLPGFGFSSPPPNVNFTYEDTARVLNTLMTEVLGYQTYAVSGTDWGAPISFAMYENYNSSVRAAHFSYPPFEILNETQLASLDISLDNEETINLEVAENWLEYGQGYRVEQGTKPQTIGLALQDNPVGQLSWIGEKMIGWSDPRAGTSPSVLNHTAILRQVSLSYLTRSFTSSVFMYYQNAAATEAEYVQTSSDAPFLVSIFMYNIGFWPWQLVKEATNLVWYNEHDFGGHFPGLDNPPALLNDIRQIGAYWSD